MGELFNYKPEKYWFFPSKYSDQEKKEEINKRINSNLYISSEKRDGDYSKTVKDFNGELRMESRTLSKVTGEYSDKSLHVPHIATTLAQIPNGTILIGELCFSDREKTSQDVGKILRCLPKKAVERQNNGEFPLLHYYIHDCWYIDGTSLFDMPYEKRITYVKKVYDRYLSGNPYIEIADWKATPNEIRVQMEEVFQNDGEGIVLVKKNAIVEPGKRTAWKTIKVKKELEHHIDCFFTGKVKMGARDYTGKELKTWQYWENIKTGKLLCGDYFDEYEKGETIEPVTKNYFNGVPGSFEIGVYDESGKIVSIGYISGITDEMRANAKNYTMMPCEVTCMEFTNDGNLRHPKLVRLRDDISPEDCTIDKI